jgi:hypothetical protein
MKNKETAQGQQLEHEANPSCWCDPELQSITEDGTKIWLHKRAQ